MFSPIASAGFYDGGIMPKLQSAITFQQEKYRFQLLDMQIRQDLPPEDERVLSWIHCSKGANGFIACIPTQGRWLRNEEHTSMLHATWDFPNLHAAPSLERKSNPETRPPWMLLETKYAP